MTSRDTAVIPDVAVRDLFDELRYVAGYVGVSGAATVLPGSVSGLSPWEARDAKVGAGTLRADGDELVWEIGDMQPGETRTLTYCVRIADAYVDELTNNPIVNRAQVFSDEYLKDDDWAAFMPDNDVTIAKKAVNRQIDNNGNVIFAPGAKVTASGVVKGGYNVNYQKYSWYYELDPDKMDALSMCNARLSEFM